MQEYNLPSRMAVISHCRLISIPSSTSATVGRFLVGTPSRIVSVSSVAPSAVAAALIAAVDRGFLLAPLVAVTLFMTI
jgi:hypothetical protein